MPDLAGKTLGKYRIVELIGRGGMSEVYRGYHVRLERTVAVKVLNSQLAQEPDFIHRFEREARSVAALRHPHIVGLFDFDVEDDLMYMVMEYIDGGTLRARLEELNRRGELMPLADALRIFRQIAEALGYAHQHGMLHRDIKTSNILLDGAGNAYLMDFGIARILGVTQYTATGALIGTPMYMSPEQGQGLPLNNASDIYSLGVVMYEMLSGRVPFTADTPFALIYKHIYEQPALLHEARPDLHPVLEAVVYKALAKRVEDRYQSTGELLSALDVAVSVLSTAAGTPAQAVAAIPPATPPLTPVSSEAVTPVPSEAVTVATAPAQQTAAAAKPAVRHPEHKRRRRWWRLVLAAGLVVLVALAMARLANRSDRLPYRDDFDGETLAAEWQLDPGWSLINQGGRGFLEGRGHQWAHLQRGPWADYVLQFGVSLAEGAQLHANVRMSDGERFQRYMIGLSMEETYLAKQIGDRIDQDLTRSGGPGGGWRVVRIEVIGDRLRLLIGDQEMWAYVDPNPILRGGVGFEALNMRAVQLDQVEVLAP